MRWYKFEIEVGDKRNPEYIFHPDYFIKDKKDLDFWKKEFKTLLKERGFNFIFRNCKLRRIKR